MHVSSYCRFIEGGSTTTYCKFYKTQSKSNSIMKGKGSYGGASMYVFFLIFCFCSNKDNGNPF